jgi:hypothetical protein
MELDLKKDKDIGKEGMKTNRRKLEQITNAKQKRCKGKEGIKREGTNKRNEELKNKTTVLVFLR